MPQAFLAGPEVDHFVAQKEPVVVLIHRSPFELAIGDVIEQPAAEGVARAHVAYVVHAHIPLVAITGVAVGVATGGVMLFQHQYFVAGFGQAGGSGQTADTGADHYRIIGPIEPARAVTGTDSDCTGLQGFRICIYHHAFPHISGLAQLSGLFQARL